MELLSGYVEYQVRGLCTLAWDAEKVVGNPPDVLKALANRRDLEPSGEPSLQNALDMARGGMR